MLVNSKKICSILVVVSVLLTVATSLWAMPLDAYFAQDDFVLTFGSLGNPLASDATIVANGRLLNWTTNKISGWFTISAAATNAAQIVNDQWITNFDQGTFKITSGINGGGSVLWSGTVDQFIVKGYTNPGISIPATFSRPSYESEPTEFLAVGDAAFTRTSGTWTDQSLKLDWMGSYNWSYDADTVSESSLIYGNLQGRLIVPEPGSILMLAFGTASLVGTVLRKRAR